MENVLEYLLKLDYSMWYYLNTSWHNDFLDTVVPYFRNQWTWAPLYLFLLVFILMNFRWKGFFWCLFFIATFAISDQLSAAWLKEIFQRIRPCNDSRLDMMVHLVVPCGPGYSFPSSHAANHFALAIFSALTLKPYIKNIWPIALMWAFLVAYAQVYVGVHFPMDVIGGGVVGVLVGFFMGKIFRFKIGLAQKKSAGSLETDR